MIKLIAIDFNGVIVTGSYRNIAAELSERYGMDPNHVYDEIYKYHNQAAVGALPENQIFACGLKDLGIEEAPEAVMQRHLDLVAVRNKEVIAYAQELRRRGMKVIALSKNTPYMFGETVRRSGIEQEFDDIINTYDWRVAKDDPEMIRKLMEKFGITRPDEIIFIDDQEKNLTAAKQLGVHTHFYQAFAPMKSFIDAICSGKN